MLPVFYSVPFSLDLKESRKMNEEILVWISWYVRHLSQLKIQRRSFKRERKVFNFVFLIEINDFGKRNLELWHSLRTEGENL